MRHCLFVQKYREQIQEMQFSLRNIVKVDLLSKLIQLVMFLKDNLIIFFSDHISTRLAVGLARLDVAWAEKLEIFKLPTLTFCPIFTIFRE